MTAQDTFISLLGLKFLSADFSRLNPDVRKVIYAQMLRFSWRAYMSFNFGVNWLIKQLKAKSLKTKNKKKK